LNVLLVLPSEFVLEELLMRSLSQQLTGFVENSHIFLAVVKAAIT